MRNDGLDPGAILAALGQAAPDNIRPVTGGWDTAVWRVDYPNRSCALRVFRPEQAAVCRREVAAMRAAAAGGVPVPVVEASGAWEDRPALLLSWCPGVPVLHELARRPWRVWRRGAEFGRMQARIHTLAAPDELRHNLPAWVDWKMISEPRLRERLLEISTHTDALIHLDYHPLNVMADGTRITAVLDWANARAGDPRADFALTLVILRLSPTPPGTSRVLTLTLRRILELAWRRGYGPPTTPSEDLAPFHAWAGATRLQDLTPLLGKPGVWLRQEDLARLKRWTLHWKQRADIGG